MNISLCLNIIVLVDILVFIYFVALLFYTITVWAEYPKVVWIQVFEESEYPDPAQKVEILIWVYFKVGPVQD